MTIRYLFIDLETTGLPITRNYARRCERYPNPKYNIVYDSSRILSVSLLEQHSGGQENEPELLIRDERELANVEFKTNKGKYKGRKCMSMMDIIERIYKRINPDPDIDPHKRVDGAPSFVGHNVLFDLNILANECLRCSAEAKPLIELDVYSKDIFSELHDIIMLAIKEYRYCCTLEMAKMIGIEDKDTQLSSVVRILNSNDNYCGELESLQYHESEDDVRACAFVFRIANLFMNQIPESIDAITDEVYDTFEKGSQQMKNTKFKLQLKLQYNTFEYYHNSLKSLYSVKYASGKSEFYIEDIPNEHIFSMDGKYVITDLNSEIATVSRSAMLVSDEVDYCVDCDKKLIGKGRCTNCCINDIIFEKTEEFIKMSVDNTIYTKLSDFKNTLPKHSFRRSRSLNIETIKSGRSITIPYLKALFYVNNRIYEYFSLKVGSAKV